MGSLEMKSILLFSVLFLQLETGAAQVQIDLSGLAPASSAKESMASRPLRVERFLDAYLKKPLHAPPVHPKIGFQDFAGTMLARMVRRVDLPAVSANLLTESFQPWPTGTDFKLIGPLCERKGDYDFVLMPLLRIAYLDREAQKELLTPEAREKLYRVLLSEKGNKHHDKINVGGCLTVTDTENHILMIEVARYLTNQIYFQEPTLHQGAPELYDNEKNGFNVWMLQHLASYLKHDFSEFNSRPYEGFTLIALSLLYDYADDLRVKTMAQMVLDYSSAKFAVGSSGLRRVAPFRRQKQYLNDDVLKAGDTFIARQIVTGGDYRFLEFENNGNRNSLIYSDDTYHPFMAAIESYRTPEMIIDLQINKESSAFQAIRHTDPEVYASSKSFLITAGGRRRDMPDFNTEENDAWGVATTVLPTDGEARLSQLFYFLGDENPLKRNNTCVSKSFACGVNMHIPAFATNTCEVRSGRWRFFDLKKCGRGYDFYIAAYSEKPNDVWDRSNKNFGLFEVQEPTVSFDEFMKATLKNNPQSNLRANRASQYRTFSGDTIEFLFYPPNLNSNPVLKINGASQISQFQNWPRATGDVLNSSDPGLFVIENRQSGQSLVLDARDPLNPVRRLQAL